MARGKEIPFHLPSVDDLFTTQAERDDANREKVVDIPLSEIDDFPDHPFRVRDDASMRETAQSVKARGVRTPAIVRRKDDGRYEMVSGHRRKYASELAGLVSLPCIVRDMTDDEAIIEMVDANLQRDEVLPSEKAFSYKMKHDAMKRQGHRSDLTSSPVGTKLRGPTLELIGTEAGDSRNTVHRYIRLTELIPELLNLVDEHAIGMRPAVELSYLEKNEQALLFATIEREVCTPSHAQTIKLRRFSEQGKLSPDVILSIMTEEKSNQAEQIRIPAKTLSRFFKPGTSKKDMEERIVQGLELLERQERRRGRER